MQKSTYQLYVILRQYFICKISLILFSILKPIDNFNIKTTTEGLFFNYLILNIKMCEIVCYYVVT